MPTDSHRVPRDRALIERVRKLETLVSWHSPCDLSRIFAEHLDLGTQRIQDSTDLIDLKPGVPCDLARLAPIAACDGYELRAGWAIRISGPDVVCRNLVRRALLQLALKRGIAEEDAQDLVLR